MTTVSNQEFCKQCQKCCKWPGFVYLDEARVQEIARFLSLKAEKVLDRYCSLEGKRLVLKSKTNDECIFLTPEGCSIYPARPWRCATFPEGWKKEEGPSECPLLQQ